MSKRRSEQTTITLNLCDNMSKRKYEEELQQPFNGRLKKPQESRRLCISNVPLDMANDVLEYTFLKNFKPFIISIYTPKNVQNNKTKLAFVDFTLLSLAKIAIEIINLRQFKNVCANFVDEPKELISLPKLLHSSRTTFSANLEPGKCALCGETAELVCEYCMTDYDGTFYCTEEHQRRDRQVHKADCKVLPKLVRPSEVLSAKLKHEIRFVDFMKPGDLVLITHVASEKVLYVRSMKEDFQALLDDVKKAAENAKPISENPEIGDTLLALFGNNEYQRAQVMDIESDQNGRNVRVLFVDFGMTQKVLLKDLKQLTFKARTVPRQTFKVVLEDVTIESKDQGAKNYLMELEREQKILKVCRVPENEKKAEKHVVLETQNGENVNKRVQELSRMTLENDERHIFDFTNSYAIKPAKNVKLFVTDVTDLKSTGMISVIDKNDLGRFLDLRDEIKQQLDISKKGSYEPIKGEICLAKNGSRWERAAVVDVFQDGYKVLLIDIQSNKIVPKIDVRQIPKPFTTAKFAVSKCVINNLSNENVECANEKIRNGWICADEISYDNDNKAYLDFTFLKS